MTTPPPPIEWRYAAAGLGWGVAVGAATGLLLAVVGTVGALWDADGSGRLFEGVGLVLGVPVLGLLLGATLGGVAGTPGGVLNAVVQPSVRGDRAAWWSSWLVATGTAAAVVGVVAAWQTTRGVVDPGLGGVVHQGVGVAALALLPALLGGWLTARTGRRLRERRAAQAPGPGT